MAELDGPVLDRQQLSEITEDDPAFIRELFDAFREETQGHAALLQQALVAGNVQDAGQVAHSIKGAAGNLGYAEIYRMATHIVEGARAGNLNECRVTASNLPEAMQRLAAAVEDLCGADQDNGRTK